MKEKLNIFTYFTAQQLELFIGGLHLLPAGEADPADQALRQGTSQG